MSDATKQKVLGPAIGMMIVASISIVVLLLGQVANIWLLTSGAVDRLEDPQSIGMSKETQVGIRMAWNLLMILCSAMILYGSFQMIKQRNINAARRACILALIPCIGPCFVLGIPFGIWGLIVLKDREVQQSF